MIVARVVKSPHWVRVLRGFALARNQGDAQVYRCRRYPDGKVHAQLTKPSDAAPERNDTLVEVIAKSFTTPLCIRGLKAADGFSVEIDLTASWRVAEPQLLLGGPWYDRLREHGAIDALQVASDLERQARDSLASAVASLSYADLKSQGSVAPRAVEQALSEAAGPSLTLVAAAIAALVSEAGDAHLAAEASARAQRQDTLAAVAATRAEIARVKAEAKLVRARHEAEAGVNSLIAAANPGAAGAERPQDALVRIVRARRQQAPRLVAIDPDGSLDANTDPAGLPIAVMDHPKSYRVSVMSTGFLALLVIASSGRTQLLFPDELFWTDRTLDAGKKLEVPPRDGYGSPKFDLFQRGPDGKETLIAILSARELLADDELRRIWHDEGVLSPDVVKRLTARLKAMTSDDWAADMFEYLVQARRSPARGAPT
jgi:hypothetical protein